MQISKLLCVKPVASGLALSALLSKLSNTAALLFKMNAVAFNLFFQLLSNVDKFGKFTKCTEE